LESPSAHRPPGPLRRPRRDRNAQGLPHSLRLLPRGEAASPFETSEGLSGLSAARGSVWPAAARA
jgi:hypothetical protein